MAAPPFTPEELHDIRDLAARWGKIVARRAFGDAGPGPDTDLATLEPIALVALLEQQALPAEAPWQRPMDAI